MNAGSTSGQWVEKRALIVGRAYPEPSKKHIETVCTGAITEDGQLLRLYPVSLRYLDREQQYRLWTWISVEVRKSPDDKRKESFRVREDSIQVLSGVSSPSERFTLLSRGIQPNRECLEEAYRKDWTSLGVVQIELNDIRVSEIESEPLQRQTRLDVDVLPLDSFPVAVRVKYRCICNDDCPGHESQIIAWEYAEAFRAFKSKYQSSALASKAIQDGLRQRFQRQDKTTYALLGTHSRYPVWMVGQLFSFDREIQQTLF